ncbi:MAG: 16S rRNA (cytosine(1402)-N(4))-methyltransferase, partial [Solirubrobacteraceae bacterium]
MTKTHIPVLAGELMELVNPRPGEIAVDCTVGGGGHARLIADRLGPAGTLIGVDRDPLAEERFAALAAEVLCETRFIRADFATALRELREERLTADLVYLDLGMSSMQVDTWERGFSYAYDAPLDMRMDPSQPLTAAEVVNTWDERRLARLLREYGEERYAPQIARAI